MPKDNPRGKHALAEAITRAQTHNYMFTEMETNYLLKGQMSKTQMVDLKFSFL